MDDLQVQRILEQTESAGGKLVAFYHSHIDCDAYFSEEDQRAATFLDGPTHPDVAYLVVSVVDREVRGLAGFAWNVEAGAFSEMPLEVKG